VVEQLSSVNFNRRKFLAFSAIMAGAGATWVGLSRNRAARVLRMMVADAGRSIPPAPVKPDPARWSDNAITICWLGHATVLINFYGIRILTDPTFGDRCGVDLGIGTAGPKRHVAPALRLEELPPVDLVLLSHAHMDHTDLPSLRAFAGKTAIVAARNTTDLIANAKAKPATELGWGGDFRLRTNRGELRVEAVEVNHWGRRWPDEKIARGYNGYILRREGRAILFGGDTANTPLFSDLRSRGPFAAAIMPIGAYQPWIHSHCTPEQAMTMALAARADYIVPVHHQTFKLSDEPMHEPIERIQEALQREPERLALQRIGESFVCPVS
jgi:L-ascorbate metabolism protein UlaG (beta-lactamase superfamily)